MIEHSPVKAVVDQAIEEAPQAILASPDVPMALTDDLLAALQSPGMRSVFEARIRMIVAKGHTADNDDLLPIGWLPMEARGSMLASINLMQHSPPDLAWARDKLVEGLALGFAALDRLDREIALQSRGVG